MGGGLLSELEPLWGWVGLGADGAAVGESYRVRTGRINSASRRGKKHSGLAHVPESGDALPEVSILSEAVVIGPVTLQARMKNSMMHQQVTEDK